MQNKSHQSCWISDSFFFKPNKNIAILLLVCIFGLIQSKGISQAKWALTTGKLPMIDYGIGEDRLGGAKMGFIDTAVWVQVLDSSKGMYKIQLSSQRQAWMAKSFIKWTDKKEPNLPILSGSWTVKGGSQGRDSMWIRLDERVPYRSWMEIQPNRIIIEVFGTQSNTNWITQLSSSKAIAHVDYIQTATDVLQITIHLKHTAHWGYSLGYKGKSLLLLVNEPPASKKLRGLKIAVDAGHGGSNTGARGTQSGILEKDYTLLFAKALEKELKRYGAEVIMVRSADTAIDNKDRVLWLQQQGPQVLISLHLNSASRPQVKGVSTYYKHIGFRPISQAILKEMLTLGLNEFGNIGHFNFMLNAPTDFVNTLVEIAFLSNPEDEARIQEAKFHKETAVKIRKGIEQFLKQEVTTKK
jgi:N-acetylmuramoyl-L-alanine amidase